MEKKIKAAAVGYGDAVMLYSAAGVRAVTAKDDADAQKRIRALVSEGYSLIFVTEGLFSRIAPALSKYLSASYPIIIPVPDEDSTGEYTEKRISENIRRAVGSDIL